MTDLIRHMSQAEIEASEVIDKTGKPVIDPENNKKTPQQGGCHQRVVCDESSTQRPRRRLL